MYSSNLYETSYDNFKTLQRSSGSSLCADLRTENRWKVLPGKCIFRGASNEYRKNDLILIMTPEKQDKTLELSKHWSVDSTPARNEVIMKRTYPVKSVKCDKICSNY